MAAIFWWVVFPYIAGTTLILGTLYSYAYRRVNWTAPSTEIFEKKWLRYGSHSLHWGLLFALIGHMMGIFIPIDVYHRLGISDHTYHFFAIVGGGFAGLMVVFGLIVMILRKISVKRIRVHATFADYFAVLWLLIVAGLGTYMTIVYNTTVVAYEYRTTIGPWFRSLLMFRPDYQLMLDVPALFQLHVIASFILFAAIPFTKLIHMFSFPGRYAARSPQQYRARDEFRGNRK